MSRADGDACARSWLARDMKSSRTISDSSSATCHLHDQRRSCLRKRLSSALRVGHLIAELHDMDEPSQVERSAFHGSDKLRVCSLIQSTPSLMTCRWHALSRQALHQVVQVRIGSRGTLQSTIAQRTKIVHNHEPSSREQSGESPQ